MDDVDRALWMMSPMFVFGTDVELPKGPPPAFEDLDLEELDPSRARFERSDPIS